MTLAQIGNGTGYLYVTASDGTTILANIENNIDAFQKIQKYADASASLTDPTLQVDATFGYRIFGDTAGAAGTLTGTELTRFLVGRDAKHPRYKQSATIATGVITIDRISNDMLVVVDTEGGAAADNLDTITVSGVVVNDVITIVGANTARIVTLTNGSGILLSNAATFSTAAQSNQIVLRYLAVPGGTFAWYEVSRTNSLPTVANQRISSVPTEIAGVAITDLTNGGGTINLEPGVDKGYQVYTAAPVLAASWTIQIKAVPTTPYLDGDTMIVDYRSTATVGANTITIFGHTLTTAQALAGRYIAKATYRLATTTWYYTFWENNGTGAAGVDMETSVHAAATYEPVLGNPAASGYILSSTAGGVRSWIPNANAILYESTTALTKDQLLTLNSVPVAVVGAPGAGKAIEIVSASIKYTYGAAVYTADTIALLTTTASANQFISDTILSVASSTLVRMAEVKSASVQLVDNQSVKAKSNADGSGGVPTGTAIVYVTYRIITL